MAETAVQDHDPSKNVVLAIDSCVRESTQARQKRIDQNRENMDCFHMRQDWTHKKAGQSKEFLPKQNVAAEQFTSFLQQGLLDNGDWFAIELENPESAAKRRIQPQDMFKLLRHYLAKADFYNVAGDGLKAGSLQSLMILKVYGKMVPKIQYRAEYERHGFLLSKSRTKLKRDTRMVWQLCLDLVRAEDYHPDPTGRKRWEVQELTIDWDELKSLAELYPEQYDLDMIENLAPGSNSMKEIDKSRETNQTATTEKRREIRLREFWGTLIDPNSGEVLHENCVATVANDNFLIRAPMPNPLWHGKSPFVAAPIRRVPFSVWHQAVMDSPTKLNHALNEIYNLMLDDGLRSVHGVKQIREDWLEDPSQVADGIPVGETLKVNSRAPVGGKVLENVDTSNGFTEANVIYNLTEKELNASGFTGSTQMGMMAERNVKATEIVSTSQALNGITTGMVKSIESAWVSQILEKGWLMIAEFANDFSSDEMKALLGEDKALLISNMAPEERFAETASGHSFRVFGLSQTVNRIQEFQKLQAYLATISSSPVLAAEFMARNDLGKFMEKIARSLGINPAEIARDADQTSVGGQSGKGANPDERAAIDQRVSTLLNPNTGSGGDQQSQIPQIGSQRRTAETGVAIPRGAIAGVGSTRPQ